MLCPEGRSRGTGKARLVSYLLYEKGKRRKTRLENIFFSQFLSDNEGSITLGENEGCPLCVKTISKMQLRKMFFVCVLRD